MKQDYTILVPNMAPDPFSHLSKACCAATATNAVLLQNEGPAVVENGLKYVHNDTCYPALLVIGQMIARLQKRQV